MRLFTACPPVSALCAELYPRARARARSHGLFSIVNLIIRRLVVGGPILQVTISSEYYSRDRLTGTLLYLVITASRCRGVKKKSGGEKGTACGQNEYKSNDYLHGIFLPGNFFFFFFIYSNALGARRPQRVAFYLARIRPIAKLQSRACVRPHVRALRDATRGC